MKKYFVSFSISAVVTKQLESFISNTVIENCKEIKTKDDIRDLEELIKEENKSDLTNATVISVYIISFQELAK